MGTVLVPRARGASPAWCLANPDSSLGLPPPNMGQCQRRERGIIFHDGKAGVMPPHIGTLFVPVARGDRQIVYRLW